MLHQQIFSFSKHSCKALEWEAINYQCQEPDERIVSIELGNPAEVVMPVKAYPPTCLYRNRKNEDWNEWDQMDAHELLRFLLDGVSMEEFDVSSFGFFPNPLA